MTDEPQVALTAPPITHVWATTYESEFERKQRKVLCLRAENGLMLDLNHYRAPSRVWEWVENNWFIRTAVIVGLVYVVAAQLR